MPPIYRLTHSQSCGFTSTYGKRAAGHDDDKKTVSVSFSNGLYDRLLTMQQGGSVSRGVVGLVAFALDQIEKNGLLLHLQSDATPTTPLQTHRNAVCSQPDVESGEKKSSTKEKTNRGSRLATTWQLPDEWLEWTLKEKPNLVPHEIEAEAKRFKDFWIACAGQKAVKMDWAATWRNWVRSTNSFSKDRRSSPVQKRDEISKAAIEEFMSSGANGGHTIDGSFNHE